MEEAKQKHSYTQCAYASCAPLPAEYVHHIIADQQKRYPEGEETQFSEPAFHELRHQVYLSLKEAADKGKLTKAWLARELTRLTPHDITVRRQTIDDLGETNVMLFDERGRPTFHRSAALLLARHYSQLLQKWRPSEMERDSPWYVWVEIEPGSKPLMCAFPSSEEMQEQGEDDQKTRWVRLLDPEMSIAANTPVLPTLAQVPNSALLYTAWEGAEREEGWSKVAGGAARFLGRVTENDLARWNQTYRPFGIEEDEAPDIFQTARLLVLQILAKPRLKQDREAVLWRKGSYP